MSCHVLAWLVLSCSRKSALNTQAKLVLSVASPYSLAALGEEGLEPPTPRFVAVCSNPLSYTPLTLSWTDPITQLLRLSSRSRTGQANSQVLRESIAQHPGSGNTPTPCVLIQERLLLLIRGKRPSKPRRQRDTPTEQTGGLE